MNAERPARCLALERANPSAPSPKAQCAQGAPARQEGGYQPFFPFLQPPPQRPRGRSSVGGGAWQGLRQRVLCVGWGCRRGGLALPAPCRQGAAQALSSVPPRPAGGDQGIQTYLLSGWDTEGTGQPRPPAPLPGGTRIPSPTSTWDRQPATRELRDPDPPPDLVSLPTGHIALADPGHLKEQDSEEPKKKRGGWPKGKKRKPPRDLPVPRAPTTGYVIFLNEQRSQLRARHPDLPFTEITKMLATQWAQLSQEKKQRYVYEADEDKQRYIRELQAYQSSEAYRAFLRRRAAHKVQALCGTDAPGCEFESRSLDFSAIDGDESDDLYCRTCRQFFSSQHNKREHLLGKQHLQNLTGEFEKESAECLKHLEPLEGDEGQNLIKGDSEEEAEGLDPLLLGGLIPQKGFPSLDLCFLQEFIFKLLKSELSSSAAL
uniref:HMG box domain-containing protein n=1 Tax=Sus scrofa TaxID=9823 RepID=A0A4X1SKG1_PIG